MAIHDADVRGTDRNSPMPNSHDLQGLARMAAGTTSTLSVSGATDPTLVAALHQGYLQVVQSGQVSVAAVTVTTSASQWATNQTFTSLSHSLGFTPVVVAFVGDDVSGWVPLGTQTFYASGDGTQMAIGNQSLYALSTLVRFFNNAIGYNTTTGYTFPKQTITYYLCRQTANLG